MTTENKSIELIMSEFGSERHNAGDTALGGARRLEPALGSFLTVFPKASITLYTDQPSWPADPAIRVVEVDPPFDRTHPRYGWRSHDYYQAHGLLASGANIAIALDADFRILSDEFRAIVELAEIFGLALPMNPRALLRIDGEIGVDSTYQRAEDPTLGLGMTYNLTPVAFATTHPMARQLLELYCAKMLGAPGRGAVHLAVATYELGFQPHVLPLTWCVSSPRDLDSKHMWREAVALHVGHADVEPRYRREQRLRALRARARNLLGRS